MGRAPSATSDTSHLSELSGFSEGAGPARQHHLGDDEAQQSVLETAPVQTAVFGVLYSIQKERLDTRPVVAVLFLALDYLQLLLLVLQPSFGFNIDSSQWIWKVANWAGNFGQRLVSSQSYSVYNGSLILACASLLVAIVLCGWTTFSFKDSSMVKVQWPLKLLRIILQLVVRTYFIASLELFMVAVNCRWVGAVAPAVVRGHLAAYPDQRCMAMPQWMFMAVALCCSVAIIVMAVGVAVGETERNPASRRLLASPQATGQLGVLAAKVTMVVVASVLSTYGRLQAVILAFAATSLVYIFLIKAPHLNQWVNHTRVALYASAALPSLLLVPMRFAPGSNVPTDLSLAMWASFIAVMPIAFLLSYLRTWRKLRTIRRSIKCAAPGAKAHLVYNFSDAEEVEFASRVMRRWDKGDPHILDADAVREAGAIIKLGLVLFPSSATMTLLSSNFLIHAADGYHTGYSQALAAKKQGPNLVERFSIFVREFDHQAAASGIQGTGGAMDLVAYVEFQRNMRIVVRCHKSSLLAIRSFWKVLLHSSVSFRQLATAIDSINAQRSVAEQTYHSVLERYPMSAKLVRSYARFLEEVYNDPWTAGRYFKQADKLDLESQEGGMTQLDERLGKGITMQNSAIVVVNAAGIIQMANKVAVELFGWRKGELEGKNVLVLVPAPYSLSAHTMSMHSLAVHKSTSADKPSSVVEVAGLHKARYMFPVNLTLNKASASGDEATLMILLQPITQAQGVVTVWALPDGTISSVGANFADVLGSSPEEWMGQSVVNLAVERSKVQMLVDAAVAASLLPEARQSAVAAPANLVIADAALAATTVASAAGVLISHQFRHPLPMDVSVTLGGSETAPVLVFNLRCSVGACTLTLVADHLGRLVYVTAALASLLGNTAPALLAARTTLDSLMPQPWAQLHAAQWVRASAGAGAGARAGAELGAGGVMQLLTSTHKSVPALLAITPREDGDNTSYVVDVTQTTLECGLDQSRLRVEVDHNGTVVSVGKSPAALFGFDPTLLVGRALSDFVDVLRLAGADSSPLAASAHVAATIATPRSAAALVDTAGGAGSASEALQAPPQSQLSLTMAQLLEQAGRGGDDSEELLSFLESAATGPAAVGTHQRFGLSQLLSLMVLSSSSQPGTSWRVGVHAPTSAEDIRSMSSLSATLFSKRTRAAVMEVDVNALPGEQSSGVAAKPTVTLHLWRADMVCGVVEVDTAAVVLRMTDPLLHPTGLLLGLPGHAMLQQPMSQLLNSSAAMLLSLEDGRKGGLKSGQSAAGRVGPLRQVVARHADQRDVTLTAQAVAKKGVGHTVYLVLRLVHPVRGDAVTFLKQLCSGLDGGDVAPPTPPYRPAHQLTLEPPHRVSGAGSMRTMPVPSILRAAGPAVRATPTATHASGSKSRPNSAGGPTGQTTFCIPSDTRTLGPTRPPSLEGGEEGCGVSENEDDDDDDEATSKADAALTHRIAEWVSETEHLDGQPHDSAMLEPAAAEPLFKQGSSLARDVPCVPTLKLMASVNARAGGTRCVSDASSADNGGGGVPDVAPKVLSEVSAAEDTTDQPHHMDVDAYRNGKRYHKLAKVISGGKAQQGLQRFKWHSFGIGLAVCAGMVACYIIMLQVVNTQQSILNDINWTGELGRLQSDVATTARVLDNLQQTPAAKHNPLYGPTQLQAFTKRLDTTLNGFFAAHHGIYLEQPLTTKKNMSEMWNYPGLNATVMYDTKPTSYVSSLLGLWTLGNRFMANGREIHHNAHAWAAANITVSGRPEFYYLMQNFAVLYNAYVLTLTNFGYIALEKFAGIDKLQSILFKAYGLGLCSLAVVYSLWLLWRVADQRYRLFSVFLTVPQGFVRALATKEVLLDDDSDRDSDDDAGQPLLGGGGGGGRGGGGGADTSAFASVKGTSQAADSNVPWHQALYRASAQLGVYFMFWRPMAVAGTKRGLLRNSVATFWMVAPFAAWMVLDAAMFTLNIGALSHMDEPSEMLRLGRVGPGLVHRSIYHAHEACSSTVPAVQKANIALLSASISKLEKIWGGMLFGVKVVGIANAANNKIVKGLPFYSPQISALLYDVGDCLQSNQALCAAEASPYYEVTRSGLDPMIQRFILEGYMLAADNVTLLNLNSTRLQFMWQVGMHDVSDGLTTLLKQVEYWALQPLNTSNTTTMAFLVVCLVSVALYVCAGVPLFVRMVTQESRRVAELLSQLPKDAGVEEAVDRVLHLAAPPTAVAAAKGPVLHSEEGRPLLSARSASTGLSPLSVQGATLLSRSNSGGRPSLSGAANASSVKQRWLPSGAGGKVAPTDDLESAVGPRDL